jgi:hypothetical protein
MPAALRRERPQEYSFVVVPVVESSRSQDSSREEKMLTNLSALAFESNPSSFKLESQHKTRRDENPIYPAI